MSSRFNFREFKKSLDSPSRYCTWSEDTDNFQDCTTCFNSPEKCTIQPVIEWLSQNPDATSLFEIPPNIYDYAFCIRHVVAAIDACRGEDIPPTPTPRAAPSRTSRTDHRAILESDSAGLQTSRSLFYNGLPSPPDSGTKKMPKNHTDEPFIDCATHLRINDIAKPLLTPQTLERPIKREEGDRPMTPAHPDRIRGSLSTEDQRRRSRSRKFARSKSEARARSPPSKPLSGRAKLAFDTMYGDSSYDEPVRSNEHSVVDLLNRPLEYKDSREGWVYAIRDPELRLVKIGYTTDTVQERFRRLRAECQLHDTAYIIDDPERKSLQAFKQLEKLVHEDLKPHRWFWECECGLKYTECFREHHEWYKVSDDVAIKTINLWANFLLQNPYGDLRRGRTNELLGPWAERLKKRGSFPKDETHNDHDKRLQRWPKLLQVNIDSVKIDATASSLPYRSTAAIVLEEAAGRQDKTLIQTSDQGGRLIIPLINEPVAKIETATEDLLDGQPSTIEIAADTVQTTDIPFNSPEESRTSQPVSDRTFTGKRNEVIHLGTPESVSATDLLTLTEEHEQSPLPASEPPLTQDPAESKANSQVDTLTETKTKEAVLTYQVADLTLDDLVAKAVKIIRQKRGGLPERSIYGDLVQFRWPVACCVMVALHTPYAPVALSLFTWCLFLPFFVGELREWQ